MIPGFNSRFECHINGTQEPLTVLDYTYDAGLSQPYRCNVEFISLDPNLSYWSYIDKQANLQINVQGSPAIQYINGVITKFTQLGKMGNGFIYKAIIEPQLVQTKHQEKTEVYLNQSIPEILESHLRSAKIKHYKLELSQDYKKRNFVCQFQETDFNFISRWMEHEGIYYYFEQSNEFETLILTDRYTTHKNHSHFSTLKFNQENINSIGKSSLVVGNFSSNIEKVAKTLELKGYNYNDDMLPIVSEALVSEHGVGSIDIYDENIIDEVDAKRVAHIRAQEISCREQIYNGISLATGIIPGYRFNLTNHFRDENNQEYLVFEIAQKGSQRQAALSALGIKTDKDGSKDALYLTEFKAIPGNVQFRAASTTPIKRIDGIIPAKVDAETSGEYAQLDQQGRYKIRLLHSNKPDGQASDWVRKMESYLGDQYGTHFPLHKGSEVCLAFEFGNPDRPIIMGAVHNSTKNNLVTSANQKQSVTRSSGGNMMVMGDQEGQEYTHFYSPNGNTEVILGQVSAANLSLSEKNKQNKISKLQQEIDALQKQEQNLSEKEKADIAALEAKLQKEIEEIKGPSEAEEESAHPWPQDWPFDTKPTDCGSWSYTDKNKASQTMCTSFSYTKGDSYSFTNGTSYSNKAGDSHSTTNGDSYSTKYGNSTSTTHGNSTSTTHGNSTSTTHGNSDSTKWGNSYSKTMGASESFKLSNDLSVTFGAAESFWFGPAKLSVTGMGINGWLGVDANFKYVAKTYNYSKGDVYEFTNDKSVTAVENVNIKAGNNISLDAIGKASILGTDISIKSIDDIKIDSLTQLSLEASTLLNLECLGGIKLSCGENSIEINETGIAIVTSGSAIYVEDGRILKSSELIQIE
ncbi:type VI secretion system tip protein VgrG [Francisellaceae bacterium]|nr:type VI secretion system tip protein VgrG [Francisellaceae bacterium]